MTAFEEALRFTVWEEGGTSNNPLDHGGLTHHGFTQHTYDTYRRDHGLELRPVTLITESEEVDIAREYFWDPCRCDELHPEVAKAVFDMAFNSGPGNAIKTLQRALGLQGDDVDGKMGPRTLGAAQETLPEVLALAFLKERGKFIQHLIFDDPSQIAFLGGWVGRLLDQAWWRHP